MGKLSVRFWRVGGGDKVGRVTRQKVVPIDTNTEDGLSVDSLDSPVSRQVLSKPFAVSVSSTCHLSWLPIDCVNQVFYYLEVSDSLALWQAINSHVLMRTWRDVEIDWAGTWFIKLYRDIGSDPQSLRASDESYQEAYRRHSGIVSHVSDSIQSLADMHDLFKSYPNYHTKAMVDSATVDRLLSQVDPNLIVLHSMLRQYPTTRGLVMQRVLSQDVLFLRFFKDCQNLMDAQQWFSHEWPSIMDKVLGEDRLFIAIFKERAGNADPVMAVFGQYARPMVDKMCTRSDLFVKIIGSEARLASFTAHFEGFHYEQYQICEKYRQFHAGAPASRVDSNIATFGPLLKMSDWLEKRGLLLSF